MKILLAAGLYPPDMRGPATYAALIEAELPKRDVSVSVLPFATVRKYPKIIRHIIYAFSVYKHAKDCDIIYALDPISVGIPAWLAARLKRLPFLIRLGGDYAWEQGRVRFGVTETLDEYLLKKENRPLMVKILASLQTFVTKRAVAVVAPSKYLKGVITSWGVSADKIFVIYSALHEVKVPESKQYLRDEHDFTFPTIVSAGQLVPWKGFSALIDVAASLKKAYPNVLLLIIGEGGDLKILERKVDDLALRNNVRFLGKLSRSELMKSVKAADVFVLNTAYEGLSHQLIEVMDVGTPIVTTTAGGNPELISDNESGLLVPFDNLVALEEAVIKIINNEELKEHFVAAAQKRVQQFTKEHMLNSLLQLLEYTYESRKT